MTDGEQPGAYLLREVTAVRLTENGAELDVRAVRCFALPGVPGYLTGESPAEQGIEVSLPNLPDLGLPPVEYRQYTVRVSVVAPETVRVTVAPDGARVLREDATWLGIVTTPHPDPPPLTVREGNGEIVADSERVRIRVARRPFGLVIEDLADGRVLARTAGRLRQAAGLPMAPPVLADSDGTTLHLELDADEDILGFGEQFNRLVKNGQRLVLRVEDALGTGTGGAYKPVPVWHSSAGYTGFLNTGAAVTADIGHTRPSAFGLTAADEALDLFLVAGQDPKRRLSAYTELTGRGQAPPLWAFGLWMGRCRYHSRAEMEEVGQGMRQHGVPCDVLHLDPDWLVVDRLNCDFIWNEERFGDRRDFVDALAKLGLRLSVWEVPYLDPLSPRYAEAEAAGYLVRDTAGEVAHVAGTPTPDGRPRALVDVTDPEARAWWQRLHEEYLDDGVAVFKTDFGEGLPDGAELADGTPPNHAHNLYPLRYNGAVAEVAARHAGGASLVWGRSGWAGSHRYPGQWGGDAESTVAGMRATVRAGLSYALSAPGFWSHDVGGFYGPELTPELYVRWAQLGALSPLMRAHGLRPREPWEFGEQALGIVRDWVRLRYSLLPYLWQVAHESARRGWPMLRPLAFEFPDDPLARGIDDAFLLGSDLLAVPIFDDGPGAVRRAFYVPAGRWTDLLTDTRYAGPGIRTAEVPLDRMPVLVRDSALLPRVTVDPSVRNTGDILDQPWDLHVYGAGDTERELIGFDGTTTRVRVHGATVTANGSQPVNDVPLRPA